jgi:hypothetical protein
MPSILISLTKQRPEVCSPCLAIHDYENVRKAAGTIFQSGSAKSQNTGFYAEHAPANTEHALLHSGPCIAPDWSWPKAAVCK